MSVDPCLLYYDNSIGGPGGVNTCLKEELAELKNAAEKRFAGVYLDCFETRVTSGGDCRFQHVGQFLGLEPATRKRMKGGMKMKIKKSMRAAIYEVVLLCHAVRVWFELTEGIVLIQKTAPVHECKSLETIPIHLFSMV